MSVLFNKILAALPIDDDAAQALAERSLAIAQLHGAAVRFVSVFSPGPPTILPAEGVAAAELALTASREASTSFAARRRQMVEGLMSDQTPRESMDHVVRLGEPPSEIIDEAEAWHTDLIIVGARDRNWLERVLDPSVSGAVARNAHRAVLILPDSVMPAAGR